MKFINSANVLCFSYTLDTSLKIMEAEFVLVSKSDAVSEDKPKVEKVVENSTGNSQRKTLADISNVASKPSILTHDNKTGPTSLIVNEYVQQLQKENAALKKLLADKNRVIELSGAEIHQLGITLQKMQQQNLHLAQSNSQMRAELNSCKDRLKYLQHQLGCKNGLLIAKKLDLEGKRKIKACETNEIKKAKVSDHKEMEVCNVVEKEKDQHCVTNSLGPSVRKVEEKVVGENGRGQARRQSARFKYDESKPTEALFSTNEEIGQDTVAFCVKKEAEDNSLPNKSIGEDRRPSISRPSRVAAKKVQSYKEISVNLKMRRPD